MRLHFLVEGPSEAAFLNEWLPRFLPAAHTFKIIQHRGKGKLSGVPRQKPDPKRQGLLDQLPAKLRAYGQELKPDTDRLVILVNLDDDDCTGLKQRMKQLLALCTVPPTALFRIAIEEMEAFYLGDPAGIKKAYPRAKLHKMKDYEQDSICGTWEMFQQVIGARSEDKVGWAETIGLHLTTSWRGPEANRSGSFRHFCTGVLRLAGEPIS